MRRSQPGYQVRRLTPPAFFRSRPFLLPFAVAMHSGGPQSSGYAPSKARCNNTALEERPTDAPRSRYYFRPGRNAARLSELGVGGGRPLAQHVPAALRLAKRRPSGGRGVCPGPVGRRDRTLAPSRYRSLERSSIGAGPRRLPAHGPASRRGRNRRDPRCVRPGARRLGATLSRRATDAGVSAQQGIPLGAAFQHVVGGRVAQRSPGDARLGPLPGRIGVHL